MLSYFVGFLGRLIEERHESAFKWYLVNDECSTNEPSLRQNVPEIQKKSKIPNTSDPKHFAYGKKSTVYGVYLQVSYIGQSYPNIGDCWMSSSMSTIKKLF